MSNAIECKNVCKTFVDGALKVTVLNDIDFAVKTGETVAIVGASGAGKSTLLQLLAGLDKPTSGVVEIAGNDITTLKAKAIGQMRNQYLGFVYQFHHLLPEFSALENVCMPLLIRGEKHKVAIEKATTMITQVGLQDRLQHRIGELSGGERQRIAIARALVTEPKCVLADEPTGNLDAKTAENVLSLMLDLNKTMNTSFVIVTHNREIANRLDRVCVMENGSFA